jgi:dTDP-4-amino-4,6-dideoxygalactose transaminase
VRNFENEFASAYGVKHVISRNGTDSFISGKMLGIKQGDEVITAANNWISSSETISQTGAKPVFVDVHPEYYSMDEKTGRENIKKYQSCYSRSFVGQVCDIETIKAICDKHGLP